MKRREFIKAAGIGLAASAVAAPAVAQSSPEIRWRLTTSWQKWNDILYGACETLAKYVSEATDGKFRIQLFEAGEIAPAARVLDAVSSGVELGHTATHYYFDKDPTWTLFCGAPFGLNSRQQNAWYYDGDGSKLLDEFGKKFNVHCLLAGNAGAQMGGWFREEVRELEHLNGMRMHVSGLAAKHLAKLGVVVQQLARSDVYPSLANGSIDSAQWAGPYDDERLGFYRAAKYYYYPGWWQGGTAQHLMVNIAKWNGLPKSYQAILNAAAGYANVEIQGRYDARNPGAVKRLVGSAGVQLRPFSPPIMEACLSASIEVHNEISAANPGYQKVWDSIRAFRNDEYLWWQVAEYTYDTFMIRSRPRR